MQLRFSRAAAATLASLTLAIATGAVAALLGIVPDFPKMAFEGGSTTAQISNGSLTVSATPTIMLITNVGPLVPVLGPSSVSIGATVDASCNLVGGIAGDDLVITGTVDVDPFGAGDVRTGTLLTGEILALGVGDPSGTVDPFDFRFQVTGGALADFYTNEDAGVTLTIENFLFNGDCSGTYQGKPKGDVGPIPPVQPQTGCTPGYWKQKHHYDSWDATGYLPTQTVSSVFGPLDPSVDNLTLAQALALNGGGLNALIRHAVAALLNAAHPDVNSVAYPTPAAVIAATQAAVAGGAGAIEAQKNAFEAANEAGCPLN
jgi:hypothetical protein